VVSEGNADKYGAEAQANFALGDVDTLTVGVEFTATRIEQPTAELDLAGQRDPATLTGGVKDARGAIPPVTPLNFGAYLQNAWRPHRRFELVVGARYDVNSVFFRPAAPLASLAPRATAVFKPISEATLKLAYGEAFRYPTVFEAFFDDQSSVCGNPQLAPERQRTVELGGAYNLFKAWNLTSSLYFMQLEGLIVRQAVDACYVGSGPREQFVNAGALLVFGGEAGLEVRLPSVGLFANASVTHAAQTVGATSTRPANSPTVVASAGASVPLVADGHLTASARVHLLSSRLDATLDPLRAVPPALRAEVSLTSRGWWRGLTAGVTSIVQLKLGESPGSPYREPVSRDPVVGTDAVVRSVPQNLLEVRGHVGYAF
jgi:outer membrane receptor protein involved in Fe transport